MCVIISACFLWKYLMNIMGMLPMTFERVAVSRPSIYSNLTLALVTDVMNLTVLSCAHWPADNNLATSKILPRHWRTSVDVPSASSSYTSNGTFAVEVIQNESTDISEHPKPSVILPPAEHIRTGYNSPSPRQVKVGIKDIAWTKDVTAEVRATISEVMGSAANEVTMLPSFYAVREDGGNTFPPAYFITPSIHWARWFCAAWNRMVANILWRDSSAFYEMV
ncbi:uncharacterized protein EV420DRAFT_1579068 [Desarmillaria tabescens]|uniref:Uncharacterized protein n=1 Tax=Armillaria tabescens TaxID=1929756 RepID=A0AA39JG44_ARMTA|nr:uncharacterized protein EV420DRAFT_1579068 [Desarmillaria tabescens]KAK0442013.1 hypothetical protein EV420DRAFT_1579068 [Desarmillaria tabescens]